jgi:phosphatidylserine decarboxylase
MQTKNSLLGKLLDLLGINKKFSKYSSFNLSRNSKLVSPVEAKVAEIGDIKSDGKIISKNGKVIKLNYLIGKYAKEFTNGSYINFYLSPKNKHFWVTPCEGKFIYTQKNEGKSLIPVFIGIENILGIEIFHKAVIKNASISSIFKNKNKKIAMIAVGSLNVNRIHTNYEEKKNYSKGTPCGHFSLGSSMILCFQNKPKFRIKKGDKVSIGQAII